MREITKEDVFYSLKKMELFISQMNDEEFGSFCAGNPANTAMLPPKYEIFIPGSRGEYTRNIVKLEFRIL